jgi:two-component system, OmpR family, sensor histidine kinase KdpD
MSASDLAGEAEELRRSDAVKTTLLRAVSHDFRSPLTAIVTAAGALVHSGLVLDEADRRELAETILEETLRLDRLVGDLLDLSRLEAGAVTSSDALWAIEDVVLQAVDSVSEAGCRLELALDESATVQGDPHQLERVFVNLIENALRYSSGSVSVQTRRMGAEVLVRVVDSGPGIDADELERIFEPFRRGARAGERRGSGLGLAIARGFAEANGGRVWAESFPGQGAAFVVAVPLAVDRSSS